MCPRPVFNVRKLTLSVIYYVCTEFELVYVYSARLVKCATNQDFVCGSSSTSAAHKVTVSLQWATSRAFCFL